MLRWFCFAAAVALAAPAMAQSNTAVVPLPPPVCTGASQALQWNGQTWICSTLQSAMPAPVPTIICNGPNQVLQWNGSAYTCATITVSSVARPIACNGANQALQFDGLIYICATINAPIDQPPICPTNQRPQRDGSAWSCEPRAIPETPPNCIGANAALQWMNGWLCPTIAAKLQ